MMVQIASGKKPLDRSAGKRKLWLVVKPAT